MSMQKVKVEGQGHRTQNKFCPNLGVSGLQLLFDITDSYKMMYEACSGIEEVPYYF